MAEAAIIETLRLHLPFWSKLTANEADLILQNTRLMHYPKGKTIHGEANDCPGVLLIKKGVLCTYMLSEEGREITLYRLYEGDVCILSASCVLRQITFEVHIDAETDCDIILISAHAFESVAASNINAENFSYQLATEKFSDVMWAMQQILFMGFDKRLAVFLLDEASKTGSNVIHSTHEQIAKYTGSAREVVTRMLKRFAEDGIVELSRGEIKIIDKNKLRALT